MTTPHWFRADVINPTSARMLYVYVRKGHEPGTVIVHNSRHFIQHLTQDEARLQYRITAKVAAVKQAEVEDNFQYYLHY